VLNREGRRNVHPFSPFANANFNHRQAVIIWQFDLLVTHSEGLLSVVSFLHCKSRHGNYRKAAAMAVR
jgi:hypothetical protein